MQTVTSVNTGITTDIDNVKHIIDTFLNDLLDERILQANAISPDYADLWKSIKVLTNAGGKRLRPYILLLSYGMNQRSASNSDVVPAAAAQELIHLAMLVHDDIIDRDAIRYGIKNIAGQYNERYAPYVQSGSDRLHFSSSAAMLAGDLLIAEAYSTLQRCSVAPEQIMMAQAQLTQSIFRVVGGELLDTESAFRPFEQVSAVTIANQKTASYSFVGPLVMGAALAGEPDETIELLKEFGTALGVAYQLKDDLLGVFGDEEVFGKSVSTDIIEGKHTYMIETFYVLANDEQKAMFDTVFKNTEATEAQLNTARQLLTDSGAKRATEIKIDELRDAAYVTLQDIAMNDSTKESFEQLIEKCLTRDK